MKTFNGEEETEQIYTPPSWLTTHPIPLFESAKHPFTPIDRNQFEDEFVQSELILELEKRKLLIQRLDGDIIRHCDCAKKNGGKLMCTEMTCRNLNNNLPCPPQCGQDSQVDESNSSVGVCWNQHFQKSHHVTFPMPLGLVYFESKLIGLGVMTTHKIMKGQVTGEFIGVVSRGYTGSDDDIYATQVAELAYHITPIEKGNYTRFYNHCGIDPNHDALCFLTYAGPRILMVASKDIDPGQECTWHYGEYWDKEFMTMGNGNCLCKNCLETEIIQ